MRRRVILILIFMFTTLSQSKSSSGRLVQTKSGKIRGHYLTSYKGNLYEAYQGIPFAEPPTGERRFQSPVPVKSWSDELQATKLKAMCMQDLPNKTVIGSEDCLYLNVYVPTKRKTNSSLPVIYYIYGGGFLKGGIDIDHEHYIIDYNVIFVSANYRTGSFGFLSTEDAVVPGNMGLKDQSTAIRWVHDNIEHFGGDPKKITLVGGSAGAASVHYHYLSPWSRGLFHAGISISGTAFAPWTVIEHTRDQAIELGRLVGCNDSNVELMVKCLKNTSAEVLVGAQNKMQDVLLFGPVIEKSSPDPFISDYPSETVRQGKAYDVPWITGLVSEDGLVVTAGFTNDTSKQFDDNWDTMIPKVLDFSYTIPEEQHASVSKRIREHYFGEKPINRENLHNLTKLISDRLFGVGAVNAAKAQAAANKSPVFFYYYNYRATDSLSNADSHSTENLGVAHGDDIHLVIKDPRLTPTKSPKDVAMQRHLIKIWTSVAYNGVPDIGVEWPRIAVKNATSVHYLRLAGPDNLTIESNEDFAQMNFWNSIGFDEK